MKVLVTGAAGFVGRRLCQDLSGAGHVVRALVHKSDSAGVDATEIITGDITDRAIAAAATKGVEAVVHLAGRAHVMKDRAGNPLAEYRRVNVDGTREVLDAASLSGVLYFVLASSVKAVGEMSDGAWNGATIPRPVDPYGISKLEAESLVREHSGAVSTCILRFPLVYGPGMRGNMLRLFDLIDHGWPIPVGTNNSRSILFVGNATAAITRVLEVASASGRLLQGGPFFLADGPATSTASLVRDIGDALGTQGHTLRLPTELLRRFVSRHQYASPGSTRLGAIINRLGGSLEVDEQEFGNAFAYTPPFTRESGLAETARWFRSQ